MIELADDTTAARSPPSSSARRSAPASRDGHGADRSWSSSTRRRRRGDEGRQDRREHPVPDPGGDPRPRPRQRPARRRGRHRRGLAGRDRADAAAPARSPSTPESVVLPLLLPDSPVVVWWPARRPTTRPPTRSAGSRSAASPTPPRADRQGAGRCSPSAAATTPGNTDLAWTRLTPWRALLAAALDQHPEDHGRVRDRRADQPQRGPAVGLAGRPAAGQGPVGESSDGPGITCVELTTRRGRSARAHRRQAATSRPRASPTDRSRSSDGSRELLAEELRRLDPDDVYAATVKSPIKMSKACPEGAPWSRCSRTATRWRGPGGP